jgi:hypothetical protein
MNIPGSNFTVFLLATKSSGEYAILFRHVSLEKPLVRELKARFNGTEVILNATAFGTNRIVSALFQYSTDGKNWTNITYDDHPSDGLDSVWDVSNLSAGKYYVKVIVKDEFGFENSISIQVNILKAQAQSPTMWIVLGIMGFFAVLTLIIAFVQRYRIMKRKNAELNSILILRSLFRAEAYRSLMFESFTMFLLLNRKYEKIDYGPSWNRRILKHVLRGRGLLNSEVASFIDSYYESRFSHHPVGKEQAVGALRAINSYRDLLLTRVEEDMIRGG